MVTATISGPAVAVAPLRHVLYQHHVVVAPLLQDTLRRTFQALYARVAKAGVIPVDAPFVIYGDESIPGVIWDMRIGVPISSPLTDSPAFHFMDMPSSRVLQLIHVGPYETLGKAYEAMDQYVRTNRLTPGGPPREFYLSPPNVPEHEIKTLVERPIE